MSIQKQIAERKSQKKIQRAIEISEERKFRKLKKKETKKSVGGEKKSHL